MFDPDSDVPAGHFLHEEGPARLIVRDSDGVPVAAVVDGEVVPHDEWVDRGRPRCPSMPEPEPPREFAVTANAVLEPLEMEFGGASVDRLAEIAAEVGPDCFLHVVEGQPPLVVRHADGVTVGRVEDGEIVPIEKGS